MSSNKEKNELIKCISESIKNHKQPKMFGVAENSIASACADYLRFEGYKVNNPTKYIRNIKNIDDLIDLFYTRIDSMNLEHMKVYRNLNRDRVTAKRFVNSRIKATGAKKEVALNECGDIVEAIFENYAKFKFKYNLNFSIFNQAKLGWITELAINFINKKIDREAIDKAEIMREEMLSLQDMSELEYDLDAILLEIEKESD